MWFIQSKWSDKGRAGFGEGDTRLFREALTYLDNQRFDRFNSKIQDRAELIRSAWSNVQVRVTLVIAVMGDGILHPEVKTRLEDLKEEFSGYAESLDYEVWGAREIWQIVRDDNATPSVDVVAKLDQWLLVAEPFEAYQGQLSAGDVADWYAQHGDRLFEQNIQLRRQNAVHTIVDVGWIREGTALTFKTRVSRERSGRRRVAGGRPKRAQATWVNHRSRPLLWAYDGQRYSPTGLVTRIWTLANWTGRPAAVQGTAQWYVAGEGSLADIAKAIQEDLDDDYDPAGAP